MTLKIGQTVLVPGKVEELFQGGRKSAPEERVMVRINKFSSGVYNHKHVVANDVIQALIDAVEVLVRTDHIVEYLVNHDPNAMQQLLTALKQLPRKNA